MKKILSVLIIVSVSVLSFASDFSDLLDKAKDSYAKGNLNETINLIDSARKIVDKESLNSTAEEYIEVAKWDIVKLKKDYYIGKKVKITTTYCGLSFLSSDKINLTNVGSCYYDNNLVDKILSFEYYSTHTFYGIVRKDNYSDAELYIEKID